MSTIPRRKFIQLSAAAAAGCLVQTSREARADDLPPLTSDDPMAQAMKYTDDASTVDVASRNNPAADQSCANCALIVGTDGDRRPCQIFPGKSVAANGWCSVWAPKA
ncbi:MAG: high-potential iron-sulfur protein [Woeseiaceae bacterium]|nr:high-potential iron-sulfur protein [Woeseiaceae bacterium]